MLRSVEWLDNHDDHDLHNNGDLVEHDNDDHELSHDSGKPCLRSKDHLLEARQRASKASRPSRALPAGQPVRNGHVNVAPSATWFRSVSVAFEVYCSVFTP